jgi:two-component system, cell cycle sensor histidine kinase and response regulator CckA
MMTEDGSTNDRPNAGSLASEPRLRSLIASMTDLVFVLDADRVFAEYYQPPGTGLFSPPESFVGRSIHEVDFPEPALSLLAGAIEAVESTGEPQSVEYTLALPRGATHFEARLSRIDDDQGRYAGTTIVARDITQRKIEESHRLELERQLHESRRLEGLGLLAGGVAHDFNNLLTAIIGNLELLKEEVDAGGPAGRALRAATVASLRAAEIARKMLMLSGGGGFNMGPLDLAPVLTGVVERLWPRAPANVALRLDLAPAVPEVVAEARQIEFVVEALVENAFEAIGKAPGTVTVRHGVGEYSAVALSAAVPAAEAHPGRFAWFEVEDDGPGMDALTASKMFDPFFSTRFIGRGLGLAASQGIIRGHRGAFLVSSEFGRGTRVRALLPVRD